jgi:hypothetical protein
MMYEMMNRRSPRDDVGCRSNSRLNYSLTLYNACGGREKDHVGARQSFLNAAGKKKSGRIDPAAARNAR